MPAPEALARAVRQRRAETRMSQEDVRRASGLSITTISKIERGEPDMTVQVATLRRLDLALSWPVGTAESWYAGRGGVVSTSPAPAPAEPVDIGALVPAVLRAIDDMAGGVSATELLATMSRFEPRLRRALLRALIALADELDRP